MKKATLLLAIHCHQPVDNFDRVFKLAYDRAYMPFLEVLKRHPRIKVTLHYSGCLIDWILNNRPEFLKTLKALSKRGQVEFMTGGYYEPILSLIPDRDKLGQIELLSRFIKDTFGTEPNGLWLAERIWEPHLPKILGKAGVEYTIVDDSHFLMSGKAERDLFGYYITEAEGVSLKVFASLKTLRYSMPFKLPHETISFLRNASDEAPGRLFAYGDDGEKFGLWPHTYKWVYEEKWLENFFAELEANADWIDFMTFGEAAREVEPLGRAYLPCASYSEMMEWSGGYFNNMLVKYPESNNMHKRMFMVSEKLEGALKEKSPAPAAGALEEATIELYKSQCNCGYWHGVFGGLYLYHLRASIYNHLTASERLLDILTHKKGWSEYELCDYDKDGHDEVVLNTEPLVLVISPEESGGITEIDYRAKCLNILNVISRKREPYHDKLKNVDAQVLVSDDEVEDQPRSIHDMVRVKEKALEKLLAYDRGRRVSLVDHFFRNDVTLEAFARNAYEEAGDSVGAAFAYAIKRQKSGLAVTLSRDALAHGSRIKLAKTLTADSAKPDIGIDYLFTNKEAKKRAFFFGVEFNFSARTKDSHLPRALESQKALTLKDEWNGIVLTLSFDKKMNVWQFPIFTVSESALGLEKNYQGLCVVFTTRFELGPDSSHAVKIGLSISS